jgi:hypothetical protein
LAFFQPILVLAASRYSETATANSLYSSKIWKVSSSSHSILRAHFLPNGNHNPGELRQSQLVLLKPCRICHVKSIFLGSSEPTTARTHRCRSCPGPGPRAGPKVQNLCELSRPKP